MWILYLYVCTNFMVCKRQYVPQFGREFVSSIRKIASASGAPDSLHVSSSCAPLFWTVPPPNKSWVAPGSMLPWEGEVHSFPPVQVTVITQCHCCLPGNTEYQSKLIAYFRNTTSRLYNKTIKWANNLPGPCDVPRTQLYSILSVYAMGHYVASELNTVRHRLLSYSSHPKSDS